LPLGDGRGATDSALKRKRPQPEGTGQREFRERVAMFWIMLTSGGHRTYAKTASARLSPRRWGRFCLSTPIGSASNEKRPPTEAASPHFSGCTSGARGLQSMIGSSTWDLRSAVLSKITAEILGSLAGSPLDARSTLFQSPRFSPWYPSADAITRQLWFRSGELYKSILKDRAEPGEWFAWALTSANRQHQLSRLRRPFTRRT
jgi:hypothetical protein